MARIVELVLIANGLGGIATYFGIKAHRIKRGARKLVGGEHDDDMSLAEATQVYAPEPEKPPKRSFLARVGYRIR